MFSAVKPTLIAADLHNAVAPCFPADGTIIKPDDYHITLRHFGTIADALVPVVIMAVGMQGFQPLQLRISGAAIFNNFANGKGAYLVATVTPDDQLSALRDRHEQTVIKAGIAIRTTSHPTYTPHITLYRSSQVISRSLQRNVNKALQPLLEKTITIDHCGLYRSTGTPGGNYQVLASIS